MKFWASLIGYQLVWFAAVIGAGRGLAWPGIVGMLFYAACQLVGARHYKADLSLMATAIVLVGCYYGYTASGGPVGVGTATAKSMVLNIVLVHIIGMLGTLVFWGANPRAPIGG